MQGRNIARNNTYVNPNYKPANKYIRPTTTVIRPAAPQPRPVPPPSTQVKDVVLNGVAFESSGRSLVRKDRALIVFLSLANVEYISLGNHPRFSVPKPVSSGPSNPRPQHPPHPAQQAFSRKTGHLIPTTRVYKPKRGRRGGPINRNMTLASTRTNYQSVFYWAIKLSTFVV